MLRYIVERIRDGKFLDLELPITVSSSSRALSGPGTFAGSLEPDVGAVRDGDGNLLLDPYSTFIHEEADGVIRNTWLVTRSEMNGEVWSVEGAGFSRFFDGMPYTGVFRGVQVDPVDVARHVIEKAQSQSRANIGVTVVGSSKVRVGTDSDNRVSAAKSVLDDAKQFLAGRKELLAEAKAEAKKNPSGLNKAAVKSYESQVKDATKGKTAAEDALSKAKEKADADGGAWKILWWDLPDTLEAFNEAVEAAGMEWVEWSGWSADKSRVLKEIRVTSTVGKQRNDLLFVEGDNIVETVVVSDDASEYANQVYAVGAGEGAKALRFTVAVNDGRRLKPHILDAKHVTKKSVLEKLARAELAARSQHLRVEDIRVVDHPNAEFGTFGVGDRILVDCDVDWLGRQRLWRRIVEVERVGPDLIDLRLGDA